jgi:hypothetical protein
MDPGARQRPPEGVPVLSEQATIDSQEGVQLGDCRDQIGCVFGRPGIVV